MGIPSWLITVLSLTIIFGADQKNVHFLLAKNSLFKTNHV